MDLIPSYDTYQDVRKHLFWYSRFFLIGAGFLTYFLILPAGNQQRIIMLLKVVSSSPLLKDLVGLGLGIGLFATLSFFLTEVFQVHDKWYDKYVIKWRHQYATDFILPRLVQPFACHLNYRFRESTEIHTREFQEQLFYPFVADRDLKIPKNKVVRFYEVVTKYWYSQINEVILLVLGVVVVVYRFTGPAQIAYRTKLLNVCLILALAFLVNRLWRRHSLKNVRIATEDEIRAIHDNPELNTDLKNRLVKLCFDYGIPYNETPDDKDTT